MSHPCSSLCFFEYVWQDLWHPYIIFLVGESTSGEAHIQALSEGIKDGNKLRKRFVNVTKEDLLKIVRYYLFL